MLKVESLSEMHCILHGDPVLLIVSLSGLYTGEYYRSMTYD